ncbi:hypothetical protein B566_EDAN015193 [Ephemera danica]|nr:hypothetical protein B566_EDAN015193 [Ephemera danica]
MKITSIVLLIFAVTTKTEPVQHLPSINIPNHRNENAGRIVGGSNATEGQFPYQVALLIDSLYFCGGALVTNTAVLTTAQCVQGFYSWEVHAGALIFSDYNEQGRLIVTSTDGQVHEEYKVESLHNDIALIHLQQAVTGKNIFPVRLPAWSMEFNHFEGKRSRVSGWGKISDGSPSGSDILQYVDVTVITNYECRQSYNLFYVRGTNICTDSNNGTAAACVGDSGGALVFYELDDMPTAIGLFSFGSSAGCESNSPTAYTRITSYLAWLATNAGVVIRP